MTWLIECLIVLTMFIRPPNAHSAEFKVARACNECSPVLYVIGKIDAGDGERFREIVKKAGPTVESLFLRSPGGSMYDSIQIGTLVSDLMLDTNAPYSNSCPSDGEYGVYGAPCTCVSGCFLIWIGGVNRYGTIVGMHRPWDMTGHMGALDYKSAAPIFKKWMADLKSYLIKMELPQAYFSRFITTVRSGDMHMLTNQELLDLNNQPSKAEWLTNRCGQWTTQENNALGQLNAAKYMRRSYNVARLQHLEGRLIAIQHCKTNAQQQEHAVAFKRVFGG